MVSRKQSRIKFLKNEYFLPLIRTCTCAYQWVRNVRFSENLMCFVFLKHLFWDSPFALLPTKYRKKLGEHAPENYGLLHWRQCYLIIIFLIQPRFPKTRSQFLCYNIARNEEGFGWLLFYYISKTRKLSLNWFKIKVSKVPFSKLFFYDSGDVLYLKQTQTRRIFYVACFKYSNVKSLVVSSK